MARIIVVSNRLPLALDETGGLTPSPGGLASAMTGLTNLERLWIGSLGGASTEPSEQAALEATMRNEHGCVPVFVDDPDEYAAYYSGYASATLWPLLHYMIERARFDPEWFASYRTVNERFADVVLAELRPGDLVWVHDYQLMLLPALLRRARPELQIGFFLHTPFPSHEVFRALPEREALLAGVLGADVIGFHTFGYARHFRSALLRTLDQESAPDSALVDGRRVELGVFPIGHNRGALDAVVASEDFATQRDRLQSEFSGRRMVLSVERLDYTKGIPQKLRAIDRFLTQHPARREDTVFFILAVPSRSDVEGYQELTESVQLLVGDINGRHSTLARQPIHFHHRSLPLHKLAALYAYAEVALVTPLVDGMNLVAKEYVDCRGAAGAHEGTLILSETAGAAQELGSAILVNPYDAQGVADAIETALDRPSDQRRAAMAPMRARIRRHDAHHWAQMFLGALEQAGGTRQDPTVEIGPALRDSIASSGRLGLVLDYDGTLRAFTARPEDAVPGRELLALLHRLSHDPAIRLAIVSGRPESFLEEHFGELDATLVAEHGFRRKSPTEGIWHGTRPHADLSWVDVVQPILEQAADLTPGTHVEVKTSALVWHYRRADPEFGAWKATELLASLTEVAANLPVEVHRGHKIVEVASQQVSKGAAVDDLVTTWEADVVIACGDDRTDESMFERRHAHPCLETIKVGPGETAATWRLPNVAAVHEFLAMIATSKDATGDQT